MKITGSKYLSHRDLRKVVVYNFASPISNFSRYICMYII